MYSKEACNLKLSCPRDGEIHTSEFLIMDTDLPSGLGHEAINKMKLLTKNINTVQKGLREEYDDLFHGLGKIKCEPYKIRLIKDYVAKISPCRKVPFALRLKVKDELDRM